MINDSTGTATLANGEVWYREGWLWHMSSPPVAGKSDALTTAQFPGYAEAVAAGEARRQRPAASVLDAPCDGCGLPLGPEAFLGPVCGKCVRKRHARAVGRR